MKQFKNLTLAIAAGLLVLSVATVSCKKKSGSSTSAPTITGFTPATDTIGGTITITGTGFASPATVTINGVAATTVTVVSSTQITAVIPTGATSGAIKVTVNGQSGTSTSSLTIGTLFSIHGLTSSNQVEATSLIGYWPFDGSVEEATTATAPVLSGGTHSFVAGKIGQAVHLTQGWLTYPASATLASSDNSGGNGNNDTLQHGFTVSMWIQVPDTSLLTNVFSLYSPNIPTYPLMGILYRKAGGFFQFDGGAGTVDNGGPTVDYHDFQKGATNSFNDSLSWAFIAMVYDTTGHNLYYYANNIKIATISLAASGIPTNEALLMVAPNYAQIGTIEGYQRTPNDNNASNTVGDPSNVATNYFSDGLTGNIDDVRFYNKTLTATDLDDLYQLGNHGQ